MSLNGMLALLWLGFCFCLIVGFGYFVGWLDDRAEHRQSRNAAE